MAVEVGEPVAGVSVEPDNATNWYANIESLEWLTPEPLAVGSRIAVDVGFLGRRLRRASEVRELVEGERLVMHRRGPFPVDDLHLAPQRPGPPADGAPQSRCAERVLHAGRSRGRQRMRRANPKDLTRLTRLRESQALARTA